MHVDGDKEVLFTGVENECWSKAALNKWNQQYKTTSVIA